MNFLLQYFYREGIVRIMNSFSSSEWKKIFVKLEADESAYGLPVRMEDSLVFSSFNIRKFGRLMSGDEKKRSEGSWEILITYCERCDFIAIQEVLDDLSSLLHLREKLGENYSVVFSDAVGAVPGRGGSPERLAYLYRNDRIKLTEMVSDVSFERSAILDTLYADKEKFFKAFQAREKALEELLVVNAERKKAGKRKRPKPPFVLPSFVQFIRTPHTASFEVKGEGEAEPYRFIAVNAHLLYGDKSKQKLERELEFKALIGWILNRAKNLDRVYQPNIFLFGDLNLDFANVDKRREAIEKFLKSINEKGKAGAAKVNFPFFNIHPSKQEVFRTNARRNQTYDQIALIARDKRLPPPHQNDEAGKCRADSYDYGMFDFVELFSQAIPKVTKPKGKLDYRLFEYDVSDHMPIWIKLPKPHEGQQSYRWR